MIEKMQLLKGKTHILVGDSVESTIAVLPEKIFLAKYVGKDFMVWIDGIGEPVRIPHNFVDAFVSELRAFNSSTIKLLTPIRDIAP